MKVSFDLMCIDERDSPNLTELSHQTRKEIKDLQNRRYFGLCGVINPGAEYPDINITGRRIQEKCFGIGRFKPFHYSEMLNCSGRFAFLGVDPNKQRSIYTLTNNFVEESKFKIIGSFVDKQILALKHGVFSKTEGLIEINKIRPAVCSKCTPGKINLYDIALKFLLKEYYLYLKDKNKRGIMIAEARGEMEDQKILDSFYRYQKTGTGSLSGGELRQYIIDLLIIRKEQNHLGLQIADLVTYPVYDYFVPDHNIRDDHFIKREILEKKLLRVKAYP